MKTTSILICAAVLFILASPGNANPLEPIVVSGFEPFGGRKVNASFQTAKAIAKAHSDRDLTLVEVPVIWGAPEKTLSEQQSRKWKLWLAFGEGKNDAFWIETVADNRRGKSRDNDGQPPAKPLILDGAPDQLVSNFPVQRLVAALNGRGVPARSSKEAGNYLCEEMLFNLLHAKQSAETKPTRIALFIHTPVMGARVRLPDGTETRMNKTVMNHFASHILEAITEATRKPGSAINPPED